MQIIWGKSLPEIIAQAKALRWKPARLSRDQQGAQCGWHRDGGGVRGPQVREEARCRAVCGAFQATDRPLDVILPGTEAIRGAKLERDKTGLVKRLILAAMWPLGGCRGRMGAGRPGSKRGLRQGGRRELREGSDSAWPVTGLAGVGRWVGGGGGWARSQGKLGLINSATEPPFPPFPTSESWAAPVLRPLGPRRWLKRVETSPFLFDFSGAQEAVDPPPPQHHHLCATFRFRGFWGSQ